MKTLIQCTATWLPTLLVGLLTVSAALPVVAQETERRTEIKIENGKVWVNGQEIPEGADLKDYLPEGMEDLEIRVDDEGDRVVIIETSRKDGDRIVKRIRTRGGDGSSGVVVFDNDTFDWTDDEDRVFKGRFFTPDAFMKDLDHDMDDLFVSVAPHVESLAEIGPAEILHGFLGSTPEIREKERKSREIAREIRGTSDSGERAQLEGQLNQLLAEIFEMKQDLRRERIGELESRLSESREALQERDRNRDEIIARRKSQLLGERSKYDW